MTVVAAAAGVADAAADDVAAEAIALCFAGDRGDASEVNEDEEEHELGK